MADQNAVCILRLSDEPIIAKMPYFCVNFLSEWTTSLGIETPYGRHYVTQYLPYKVKMQYVQISNIVDTSIKHQISGQFTSMVKDPMNKCLIW